ncbi:MAG: DnaJ domain-containing protein [Treponema sp.]|jgi:curved DNA-binding protein CbpA|nr:DnaJ domain-containing protein [Treponema sp.]
MEDYYSLLGVPPGAPVQDIKRAFREKAKRLHPDIAGKAGGEAMRRLLAAYEVLADTEKRGKYDRALGRFREAGGFDYRAFLRENLGEGANRARLIFFDLIHLENDEAVSLWREAGGLDFPLDKYLDREDWLDCSFILAEELDKRGDYYGAFRLFAAVLREERQRPYFRHFTGEIEALLKNLARLRLRPSLDTGTWAACLETLLELGFPYQDEARWQKSLEKIKAKRMRQ